MNASSQSIGQSLDRVDGLLKVTGQASYAGEYPEDGLLHGSVVSSKIDPLDDNVWPSGGTMSLRRSLILAWTES